MMKIKFSSYFILNFKNNFIEVYPRFRLLMEKKPNSELIKLKVDVMTI